MNPKPARRRRKATANPPYEDINPTCIIDHLYYNIKRIELEEENEMKMHKKKPIAKQGVFVYNTSDTVQAARYSRIKGITQSGKLPKQSGHSEGRG